MNNPFTICNGYGCGISRVHYPVAVALFQCQHVMPTETTSPKMLPLPQIHVPNLIRSRVTRIFT